MIQQYREDDGMDPGLSELAYDGTEYEVYEFGERIESEDGIMEDEMLEEDIIIMDSDTAVEDAGAGDELKDGFAETLNPDAADPMAEKAEASDIPAESAADKPADTAKSEDIAQTDKPKGT